MNPERDSVTMDHFGLEIVPVRRTWIAWTGLQHEKRRSSTVPGVLNQTPDDLRVDNQLILHAPRPTEIHRDINTRRKRRLWRVLVGSLRSRAPVNLPERHDFHFSIPKIDPVVDLVSGTDVDL
jgi:hypothetical protein